MQNNVQVNIPGIIEIAENTNQFHQRLAVEICQEFGGFLKIHPVISSEKYQVSQLKFRKGSLIALPNGAILESIFLVFVLRRPKRWNDWRTSAPVFLKRIS